MTPGSYLTLFMTYKLKQLDTSEEAKVFNEQDVKGPPCCSTTSR